MFKWLDVEANSHHSEGSIVLHEEEMVAVPSESCCCVMISQITLIPIICLCNWNVWSSFKNKLKRSCRKCLLYEIVNSKFFLRCRKGRWVLMRISWNILMTPPSFTLLHYIRSFFTWSFVVLNIWNEPFPPPFRWKNWTFYRDNKMSIICKFIDFL